MKSLITSCIIFLAALTVKAQYIEKKNFGYNNGTYDVFIVKIDSSFHERLSFLENSDRHTENIFVESFSKKTNSPFFLITASIVDSSCQPLGLFIKDGKTFKSINLGSGEGSFYLLPNGVLSIYDNGKILVQDSRSYDESKPVKLSIQSGPLLIDNGTINAAFNKNSKNKFIRCGVGTYSDKGDEFIVFIKSVEAVSFYQLAEVFGEKFNCKNALTLQSGSDCSMHLPSQKKSPNHSSVSCRYLAFML